MAPGPALPHSRRPPIRGKGRVFRWLEWGLLLAALVLLVQRFGPQVGAALGLTGDLGRLPDFRVVTLDGAAVTSDDLAGQVVLVNFWATWCGPCRFEMPGFQRVWEEHQGRGFLVLGLATDREGPEVVSRFVEDLGVSYPVAMATPQLERAFGGLPGLPTSFLVDRHGVIRSRTFGFYASPTLSLAVRRLLEEESVEGGGGPTDREPPG